MARNGSGTYSVVNTFTSGTTITSSSHNANWSDIGSEMTNSVAADGQTTMTGALKAANGTAGAPALTFGSDTDLGFYRIGANNIGLVVGTSTAAWNASTTAVNFDLPPLPTSSDGAALGSATKMWSDLFLASGAVVNFNNGDVTVTHSANTLAFAGASSGYTHDAAILPSANDAAAVGASGTAWSDLFLASGAVINFNAGNYTLTHSAGALTASGTLTVSGAVTASNGFTVSSGSVSFPAGSIAAAALATITNTATPVATTSGTTAGFTSIPSTARVIIMTLTGVSTNGTSALLIQLGDSGGYENTGYLSSVAAAGGATGTSTAGFIINQASVAAATYHGYIMFVMANSSSNTLVSSYVISSSGTTNAFNGGGSKSTSAALDRIQLTTANGTDAFDAGEINIVYY